MSQGWLAKQVLLTIHGKAAKRSSKDQMVGLHLRPSSALFLVWSQKNYQGLLKTVSYGGDAIPGDPPEKNRVWKWTNAQYWPGLTLLHVSPQMFKNVSAKKALTYNAAVDDSINKFVCKTEVAWLITREFVHLITQPVAAFRFCRF